MNSNPTSNDDGNTQTINKLGNIEQKRRDEEQVWMDWWQDYWN